MLGMRNTSSKSAAACAAVIAVFGLTQTPAHAAQDCDAVLITATSQSSSRTIGALASLSLIDDQTFQELIREEQSKSDVNGNAVALGYGWGGFDVSQFSNYQDFSLWRSHYLQENNYTLSSDDSKSYLSTFLPAAEANDWLACKKIESVEAGRGDLSIIATNPTDSAVTITEHWIPQPDGGAAQITSTLNGKPYTKHRIPVNGQVTFVVVRPKGSEFRFVSDTGTGYSAQVFIPAEPKAPIAKPEASLTDRVLHANWVYIDPRSSAPLQIGVINAGDALILEARGQWYCNTVGGNVNMPPPTGGCATPINVNNNLIVRFEPTDGRPVIQDGYAAPRVFVGPGIVKAVVSDSFYDDNGWPIGNQLRAAVY